MTILSDLEIKKLSLEKDMIYPFEDTRLNNVSGEISFGVSSYGYDMRISNEFYIMKENKNILIDPKNFSLEKFKKVDDKNNFIIIPPKSYVLTKSLEYFKIPRDILVVVFGKSTYARCGLIVNVTPLEPEWEGYVTISIVNPLSYRIKIYCNEGIAQLIFFKSEKMCKISYKNKKGKYQSQKTITPPK